MTDSRRTAVVALTLAALAGIAVLGDFDSDRSIARARSVPSPPATAVVTVSPHAYGRPIQPGFIGLSLEYPAVTQYAGTDPGTPNPVLVQLIRNLAPGRHPSLRIGGDSTDRTWAPAPGVGRPKGVRFALTNRWIGVTRSLAQETGARLILGIDLEANRRALAAAEARALVGGIGRGSIAALELGNEPELYRSFAWYRTPSGIPVHGRASSYDFRAFDREFTRFGRAMPPLPLAGPTIGGWQWIRYTPRFVRSTRDLQMVTVHRYPLQRCHMPAASSLYPTIPHLLTANSSGALAANVEPYVAAAHARGLPLRIDEINSASCGGAHGVSDTFASALWAVNAMFALASVGVDGVNIHTFPGARYGLFSFDHAAGGWQGTVAPEYYGLILFARAAPPGSRLVRVQAPPDPHLTAWATRARDRHVRVVLVNTSSTRRQTVDVRTAFTEPRTARLTQLTAPALSAMSGVALGGQRFAAGTTTGLLQGSSKTITVTHARSGYTVTVPPASAAMLTLPQN